MTEHHDRDTVVVERDRGSGNLSTLLGILVILALLAAVWYFALGPGAGGGTDQGGGSDTQPQASLGVPGGAGGDESGEPAAS